LPCTGCQKKQNDVQNKKDEGSASSFLPVSKFYQ